MADHAVLVPVHFLLQTRQEKAVRHNPVVLMLVLFRRDHLNYFPRQDVHVLRARAIGLGVGSGGGIGRHEAAERRRWVVRMLRPGRKGKAIEHRTLVGRISWKVVYNMMASMSGALVSFNEQQG